MDIKLDRIVTL